MGYARVNETCVIATQHMSAIHRRAEAMVSCTLEAACVLVVSKPELCEGRQVRVHGGSGWRLAVARRL